MSTSFLRSRALMLLFLSLIIFSCNNAKNQEPATANSQVASAETPKKENKNELDTARYNSLMVALANGDTTGKWPAKAPLPLPGAVLPFNRIVAYYGNLYSTRMGILGELPKAQMFTKLKGEMARWQAADSSIPVIPALHYIAVTAQGYKGQDGKHRLRMPAHQIDTIMNWAKEINALVFLDIQVGHSTVQAEIPQLEKYLSLPNVHLGIDPEFSMKNGEVPGSKIGTFSADDINYAINYLQQTVKKNNLPPKILVVHRFTQGMVTNYQNIKKIPEVQIVIDMDGWGDKILKKSSYLAYVKHQPVQFAGFKLFYKNDIKKDPNGMYTPEELLKFIPKPIYIQYQ
jgi:hypothetical protein